MTTPSYQDNRLLGVLLMLAAAFVLTSMDATVKWAVSDYSVAQVNLIRSVSAIIVLSPIIMRGGGLKAFVTTRPLLHLGRAALMILLSYSWFFALGQMKFADLGAIIMLAPLFVTALSAPLLGEKVGPRRWIAVGIGFVGMIAVMRPGTGVFNPIAVLGVTTALGYALFIISNRLYREKETLTALTYYPMFAILAVSLVFAPSLWVAPTPGAWVAMLLVGVMAGVGHLCLTLAFRYAPPVVLAPLEYTGLIWVVSFGYIFFAELPDMWTVGGMLLIAGAGVFVVYREARQGGAAEAEDIAEVIGGPTSTTVSETENSPQ